MNEFLAQHETAISNLNGILIKSHDIIIQLGDEESKKPKENAIIK